MNKEEIIQILQQENKQLKYNWNELKKYAKKIISTDNELYGTDLLNKMQELQENSNKLGRICKIMLGNIPKRIYITKDQYLEYKQLQQESKQLKERIEYLERSNNRREDTILEQRQEISDLEDNWNKLREFIAKEYYMHLPLEASTKSITILIGKMRELQGSDSK